MKNFIEFFKKSKSDRIPTWLDVFNLGMSMKGMAGKYFDKTKLTHHGSPVFILRTVRGKYKPRPTTLRNHKVATNIHRNFAVWMVTNKDQLPRNQGKQFNRANRKREALA